MTEIDFWNLLGYRVTSEMAQFEDAHLRYLWCDGFEVERSVIRDDQQWVIGEAWIGQHKGTMEAWPFDFLLGPANIKRSAVKWSKLLPSEDETKWLAVDLEQKRIEIIPPVNEELYRKSKPAA